MILLSHERQCFSRTNNRFGTTPTACIRFAVLSRIEILHILLEHSYDSQRNENAGSARRLHRRQPVARSQDLLSPLRQFQRRVAVVGSVAHARWLSDQAQPQCDLARTFGRSEINDPFAPSISIVFGAAP